MDQENQGVVYFENVNDLCRLCLRNEPPLQNLFFEINLLENVQEVTSLSFNDDDSLPNSICQLCVDQVNSFMEFRVRCKNTDEWLRGMADVDHKDSMLIDSEVMDAKDMPVFVEPDLYEEQLVDDPVADAVPMDGDGRQIVENEIDLSHCIIHTEEVVDDDAMRIIADGEDAATGGGGGGAGDHQCTVCGKELLSAYTLANHMRSHTGERPYGCSVCEKFFKTKSNLNEHYRVHNPELRWMKTSSRDIPSITRVTITSEDMLTCGQCSKVFASLDELSAHERAHAADGQAAEPRRHELQLDQMDREIVVETTVSTSVTCERCDRNFGDKSELAAHHAADRDCLDAEPTAAAGAASPAAKRRRCPFCDKQFRSVATLENHKRVHTREKPFECNVCAKPFRTKGNLLEHKRVHRNSGGVNGGGSGLQQSQWTADGSNDGDAHNRLQLQSSAATISLAAAAASVQPPSSSSSSSAAAAAAAQQGDQRFQCTYCAKPFRTYTALLNHERVHTREKPFECSVCGKCFRTKSNLTEHMKGCHDMDLAMLAAAGGSDEVQVFTFKTQPAAVPVPKLATSS